MIASNTTLLGAELRRFRAAMARAIAGFIGETEYDLTIPFATIDRLPNWLLLERTEVIRMARLLGGAWYLPGIRNCIDGGMLRQISEIVGDDNFKYLLQIELGDASGGKSLPDEPTLSMAIESVGLKILLELISDRELRDVIAEVFQLDTTVVADFAVTPDQLLLIVNEIEEMQSSSLNELKENIS